jgi:hypothetical protein
MTARNVIFLLAIGLLFTLIAGCGNKRPARVPVSGQVLFEGKPFTFGYVRFVPKGARQASGKLDSQGRFKLGSYTEDDGVVPGTHPIEIVISESASPTTLRWYAPKKYSNIQTSGLTQEINEARDNILIELKRDKGDSKVYPYVETVE